MLENEIKLMLSTLAKDKKSFKRFCKTGYFSYTSDKSFEGAVAIADNKAIISFLQDANDESKVIATVNFPDNCTFIYKLDCDNFSRHRFGLNAFYGLNDGATYNARAQTFDRDIIISEIDSVREHCAKAREKFSSENSHFFQSIFSKALSSSSKKLSKEEVTKLLEDTLCKLEQSKKLDQRDSVSPKCNVSAVLTNTVSISSPDYVKTQEDR